MALVKTLIYTALALMVVCSIEARRGSHHGSRGQSSEESQDSSPESSRDSHHGRGGRGGRGGESQEHRGRGSGHRRRDGPDVTAPCWFQYAGNDTAQSRDCGNFSTCDTDNHVAISNADGTAELYRVAFCKLDVQALLLHIGSGDCMDGEEGCHGPYTVGGEGGLHFCSSGEQFDIDAIHPCMPQGEDRQRPGTDTTAINRAAATTPTTTT